MKKVQENQLKRFVILLNQIPGFETTESLVKAHVQYLRKLDSEGKLEMCGPFTDYPGGMVILTALTLEEAECIAAEDPFVKSGSRSAEVRSWELSCEENNHMGMG